MKLTALIALSGTLALGGAALAAENPGAAPGRMQGPPNAAGYKGAGAGETTGTTAPAPQGAQPRDGRMEGSPNAAGFNKEGGAAGTGAATGR